MEPTRRFWATAGLAAFLGVLAPVLARPLPLLGAVFISAWLLSRQYLFYRATTDLVSDITVRQIPGREWVRTNETTPVTLGVTVPRRSNLVCTVQGGLPPAAIAGDDEPQVVTLEPGETSAEATVDVKWPVAGRHEFRQALLRVSDGLFEQSLPVGEAPVVTVEPQGPRNIHVGEGGDRTVFAYGEHESDSRGRGVEPAELREYVPGDTVDRIDWNATARLNTPYVRESEAEIDQRLVLFVDHRSALGTGPPAETKLAYIREVALALTDSATRHGDPLGLVTVGNAGITSRFEPATTADHYTLVRRTLLDLEPTTDPDTPRTADADTNASLSRVSTVQQTMRDVRTSLTALESTDDEFTRALRPFYANQQYYRTPLDRKPLFSAVKSTLSGQSGQYVSILCTDDSEPTEVRETVKLATRNGGSVLLLLAPTVLYEPGGVTDLETGYERYVEFEELRRELAQQDRVTALEVGPGDRLSALMSAGRSKRGAQQVGGGPS